MSDIVKRQAKSLSTPQSEQKLSPRNTEPTDFDVSDEMTSVAIAAADAPFAKAYSTYEQRFSNNLKDFQAHIRNSQSRVSQMLKTEIYKVHDVNEAEMYGGDDDDAA